MSTTTLSMCGHQCTSIETPTRHSAEHVQWSHKLVTGANCIVLAPGTSTEKLVENKSSQRPHCVTRKGSHRYCCDSDCPMWKCSKVCSHTLACHVVNCHVVNTHVVNLSRDQLPWNELMRVTSLQLQIWVCARRSHEVDRRVSTAG